ncbi:MAG: Hsp33 family molecular chaperone HslO [Oscillospiraceae bacterium]|nr:Hsp33 family molecular chaperone HslO [Oscillospiraceae bacterium]
MGKIVRAMTRDGWVKIAAVNGRDMVQRAKEIHNTTPTATAALGRLLCAASLLGNMMKEEDGALSMRIDGGGPIEGVMAVSDTTGNVRGYVGDPGVDLPLKSDGHLDVGGAVGTDGLLTVIRDIGLREPYIGSTEIVSGEIGEDVAAYMTESEQIPAAVGLGVLVETDLSVSQAGGFIVQLLPGAPDGIIEQLEDNIFWMDSVTMQLLDGGEQGAEELIKNVLKGMEYDIVEETAVEYRCNCSRERVENVLTTISVEELQDIVSEGQDISVTCQFCDAIYTFTPADVGEILARKNN